MTSRKKVMVKVYVFFEWPSYRENKRAIQVQSFIFGEYWPWHTIKFVWCQSQHIWANPDKCIIRSINQTSSKFTTLGNRGITLIFNSHLQPIRNSQFHSSQTQFSCTSQFQIHNQHNSFHGISWLGWLSMRQSHMAANKPCRFAVISPMGEPPFNWLMANLT